MELNPGKKFATPGLARGIQVFRLLGEGEGMPLEAISKQLQLPKSSLLRILETLIQLGLVQRDAVTNHYYALSAIVPLGRRSEGFAQQVQLVLGALAEETRCTAEWYLPRETGMVLVRRVEPSQGEVRVGARIGFIRSWTGELEAVARLGIAWYRKLPRKGTYWTYAKDGSRRVLARAAVEKQVKRAGQQGYATDTMYNGNGVRRSACVVLQDNKLAGVLALAENFRPANGKNKSNNLSPLMARAVKLFRNSNFTFPLGKS